MRFPLSWIAAAVAVLLVGDAGAAPPTKKKVDKKAATKKPVARPAPVAKPMPPATLAPIELKLEVIRATLSNGLRVVLNPDHNAPTVAIALTYDVGGRDDEPGKSGFAHLFEHLMFEGSKNVARGDHHALVYAHGGAHDAMTSMDRTVYYDILPSNELALGLWLEADRMKSLDVGREAFECQRKVVQEEYRMRIEAPPYRVSALKLEELVYQGYGPYERSGLSSMKDLDLATLEDVTKFHARHYGPNTAVISIAGDFDVEEAKGLVEKYFGSIPKIGTSSFVDAELPQQTAQRTLNVTDAHARSPLVMYGWPVPRFHGPDHEALEVLAEILAGGESSRLHELLVRDKAVAQWVAAYAANRRGPDLFAIWVSLADGARLADVEKLVEAEIKSFATKAPTDDEIQKAKRRLQTSTILGLQSNYGRATKLGEMELYFGDASLLNKEPSRTFAVGKDDVKRAAERWLGPLTRTIVETLPPEGEAKPAPKPRVPVATKTAPAKKTGDKKSGDKDKKKPTKQGKQ